MKRLTPGDIVENAVFAPLGSWLGHNKKRYRRVIGVLQGRVVYCNGGIAKRDCKLETFITWARNNSAICQHRPNLSIE